MTQKTQNKIDKIVEATGWHYCGPSTQNGKKYHDFVDDDYIPYSIHCKELDDFLSFAKTYFCIN